MMKILLGLFLILMTSFSLGEEEVFENGDEIQEVIEELHRSPPPSAETNPFLQELKKLGYEKLDLSALGDPRVKDLIEKQYEASNISLMSLDKKRRIFETQFKDSALKLYLDKAPRFRDFFIDLSTDKDTMMGFLSLWQRKDRIYLLYLAIGFFLLNIILKKLIISPEANFISRFLQRMTIRLFCFALMMVIIFQLFKKELTPLVKLVQSHFF